MSNTKKERSEFIYNLSAGQMKALLEIARTQDRPFLEVVMEAVDQYIEREKTSCQHKI
jgi:hypothetical protein